MDNFEPADIIVYIQGRGIVLEEKSLVAYDTVTKKIIAIGKEAEYTEQNPQQNVKVISPLLKGTVADYTAAVRLFSWLMRKAWGKNPLFCRHRIAICAPKNLTMVERKALEDAFYQAGAKEVFITDMTLEQLIQKLPELPANAQKSDTIIAITKKEPERYIKEGLSSLLQYAIQEGISAEEVLKILQELSIF